MQWRILDAVNLLARLVPARPIRVLTPVALVCLASLAAAGAFRASASSEALPQTTPEALIASMRAAEVTGFSGTVVSELSLGLPVSPTDSSFAALLSGSHTMQVWHAGKNKQRIALLGTVDETDIFRIGEDVWQWNSSENVAEHRTVAATTGGTTEALASALMPSELARRTLASLDRNAAMEIDTDNTVADRAAYDLVLRPGRTQAGVDAVHIAVDGATKVPLGIQVYAHGANTPAIDVGFTAIHFAPQTDQVFRFAPPPRVTVRNSTLDGASTSCVLSTEPSGSTPAMCVAPGWASVLSLPSGSAAESAHAQLLAATRPVAGRWGKGRLLQTPLLSVLITDDGRCYAGTAPPQALFKAAAGQ